MDNPANRPQSKILYLFIVLLIFDLSESKLPAPCESYVIYRL